MIVSTRDVRFSYGRREVLRGVTTRFGLGVNGLLGPNGAGKTTLLRILASTASPASGEVVYEGVVGDPRSHIGFLPQHFEVLSYQSVRRNVEYAAWVRGVKARDAPMMVGQALEAADLVGLADRRARSLSGGERQRLGIACSTVHRPSLVVLDEPTVGLDPEQRVSFRRLVHQLGESATVVLSTHIVDDLAHLGGVVTVMADGSERFSGTVEDIIRIGEAAPVEGMSALEAGYVHLRGRQPVSAAS